MKEVERLTRLTCRKRGGRRGELTVFAFGYFVMCTACMLPSPQGVVIGKRKSFPEAEVTMIVRGYRNAKTWSPDVASRQIGGGQFDACS